MRIFGEMVLLGEPQEKLLRAMAVVADTLHLAYDAVSPPGWSKTACIRSSRTVELFFQRIGLDAQSRPVALLLTINNHADKQATVRLIGSEDGRANNSPGWNGHMITICEGFLIDPTFSQIDKTRKLPTMLALPTADLPVVLNLKPLARFQAAAHGKLLVARWLDTPKSRTWMKVTDPNSPKLSRNDVEEIVSMMVDKFKTRLKVADSQGLG